MSADSEKNEGIIADYAERVRTLQRNYLIMIGLALFFFLLFSFPYFSVENALYYVTKSQNQLNNLDRKLSTPNLGYNDSERVKTAIGEIKNTIGGLQQSKKEIAEAVPSINSPVGTLKIRFTQIDIFYPVALSIGFFIVCLELLGLIRYCKWVMQYRDKSFYEELITRSPGIINVDNKHHIIVFVSLPFTVLILSIIMNLYSILYINVDLTTLKYGPYYQPFIFVLYILSTAFVAYLVCIVRKNFKVFKEELKKKKTLPKPVKSRFKVWLQSNKAWKIISITIIILLLAIIGILMQSFHICIRFSLHCKR